MSRHSTDLAGLVARLHEHAAHETGLDDFGSDDYLEGLERLLSSIVAVPDAHPSEIGRMTEAVALAPLVGRLRSEQGWADRPQCLLAALPAPLLITGMPRTGTTALHKLLAVDPQFQVLESWLIAAPKVRPPRDAWSDDPAFRTALERAGRVPPTLRSAHFTEPAEADECLALMAQSFVSNQWGSSHRIAEYDAWALAQDMRPSVRRYADNLRLIGADEPEHRWLLKNPSTALAMESFLEVFPDASVVQTHRDPTVAMGSLVSLLVEVGGPTARPSPIVERELPLWSAAMQRMEDARVGRESAFYDVDYQRFVGDPVGTARSVYEYLGLELTHRVEVAMRRWVEANPATKYGVRHYSPDECGITESLIEEHFADYCDRHDLRASR